MNVLHNLQQWVGNLGKDPELQYLPSGTAKVTFSIAVNTMRKTDDGWEKGDPEWVDITAYGKRAETAAKVLKKGTMVLAQTTYRKNRRDVDGQVRIYHNFILQDFTVLRWPDRDERAFDNDDYEPVEESEFDENEFPF